MPAIGFLTIQEHADFGLLGGYLVLNTSGRPLEFHCTAPVRANRVQEILYGPTLKPYLFGEQIGQTLVEKAKTLPFVVCTDVLPAMAMREHCDVPLVHLPPQASRAGSVDASSLAEPTLEQFEHFELLGRSASVAVGFAEDAGRIQSELKLHEVEFDLDEPFQRIREAIEEAQKSRKAA